ncbi:MAG: hypothetical protein V4666_08395 [Bacteroidota bacterium]
MKISHEQYLEAMEVIKQYVFQLTVKVDNPEKHIFDFASYRLKNVLYDMGFNESTTIKEVAKINPKELLKYRNCGQKSYHEFINLTTNNL